MTSMLTEITSFVPEFERRSPVVPERLGGDLLPCDGLGDEHRRQCIRLFEPVNATDASYIHTILASGLETKGLRFMQSIQKALLGS